MMDMIDPCGGERSGALHAHSTPDPEPAPPQPIPVPDDVPDPIHAPVEEPKLPEPPIRAH